VSCLATRSTTEAQSLLRSRSAARADAGVAVGTAAVVAAAAVAAAVFAASGSDDDPSRAGPDSGAAAS
jgi:hypothetical protein